MWCYNKSTEMWKNISACLNTSNLNAARQLGQPMYSLSADFWKYKLNSLNLAGIILHDSVGCLLITIPLDRNDTNCWMRNDSGSGIRGAIPCHLASRQSAAIQRTHTVLFSEVTLDEIGHQIWVPGGLGEGLDHMWREYEQIPASPFWDKFEKPLFYYKKCSRD